MRRPLLAALLALTLCGTADAATKGYPITLGENTRQVCDAEWFLRAQRPNVYRNPYYRIVSKPIVKRNGQCKWTTADAYALRRLKYRLGYPPRALKPPTAGQFGRDLRSLLLGKWARSQEMQHFFSIRKNPPKRCDVGDRIVSIMRSQLGASESWGNNWGPSVSSYQAVTGAYRAAWCVSFAQWVYLKATGHTFADRTAGVYYALGWAQRAPASVATWSRTRQPHKGDIAIFHTWQGHMGIVESHTPGGFYSVEGNASNTVLRRFHPWGARNVSFIHLPGTDKRITCGSVTRRST